MKNIKANSAGSESIDREIADQNMERGEERSPTIDFKYLHLFL